MNKKVCMILSVILVLSSVQPAFSFANFQKKSKNPTTAAVKVNLSNKSSFSFLKFKKKSKKLEIPVNTTYSLKITKADTIDLNSVIEKAINNSYDLKTSKIDIDISKYGIKEARADYFPTLKYALNKEYDRRLRDQGAGVTSVGGQTFSNATQHQDSMSLNLSYKLLDFGERGKKLSIAKNDKTEKEITYKTALRDLQIKVIDLYKDTFSMIKEKEAKLNILSIENKIFKMQNTLYLSGAIPKTEVQNTEIKIETLKNELETLNNRLSETLEDLSFYTFEEYDPHSLQVTDLDTENDLFDSKPDYKKTLEYQYYEAEIAKKKAEIRVLRSQMLPNISMYSNYNLYGSDSQMFSSSGNVQPQSVAVGISANFVLFDGFKTSAKIGESKKEIEKLEVQREQKIREFKNKYDKLQDNLVSYQNNLKNSQVIVLKGQEKYKMVSILTKQELTDATNLKEEEIEVINRNLEFKKAEINKLVAIKKLNILLKDCK